MDWPAVRYLEAALVHRFRDPDLLLEALTHSSYSNEAAPAAAPDNERLEFLGDAVLTLVISEIIFARNPDLDEGGLSRLRSFLVSAANIIQYAEQLKLGKHLRLGRGEEKTGGRSKKSLLVGAFEATLAAVYLDGGIDAARRTIERLFHEQIESLSHAGDNVMDFKSALQERLQAAGRPTAEYRLLAGEGPEHEKVFTVEVLIGGEPAAVARAATKRAAEQAAAMEAIRRLEEASPAVKTQAKTNDDQLT